MAITWASALAWRLDRHFLTGEKAADAANVIGRLTTIPAWSGDPEFTVAIRLAQPSPHAVATALTDGRLIRTFSFGGATHLMRPQDAGAILAIRSAGRQWERKSWQEHYRLRPHDWPDLREVVRDAVSSGPLTRAELAAAVTAVPRFAHLRPAFVDPSHTFIKPFAWQGDVALGPPRDGQITLQTLIGQAGWSGIPPLDEAGPLAVLRYLSAYGPASIDRLHYWFGERLSAGRQRIERWVRESGDTLVHVEIDGEPTLCVAEHRASLEAATGRDDVHLLAGHDQWILGSGTTETRIVPPPMRPQASRGASVVLVGGVVRGTWRIGAHRLDVIPADDEQIPRSGLIAAAERVAHLLGRPDVDIVVS